MAASSYTWAGKNLTPTELTNSFRTDPLPLIVKVTHVTNDYEKSCPQTATGTVLWIYKTAQEERVALKTAHKIAKYISIPLEAPIKFEVVYTHDRGPPTFLSSMLLRGKVQTDLKVEMAGNPGNRLSSTPDQAQSVPYGTLQVVGIYKETVLQAQKIVNAVGELNPQRRNISVNCPVSLDIATGIYGKSADDFRKLKERIKLNQTSKPANQADTSYDIVLLSGVPKSLQDVHLLRHTCQLSSTASLRFSAAEAAAGGTESSSTVFKAAVAKLTDKVGSEIIGKAKPRDSIRLSNSSGMKLAAPLDSEVSCDYEEPEPQRQRASGTYENEEGLSGDAVLSRARAEKGRDAVEKRSSKTTALGGLKNGVYVNDWKQKLTKGKVTQPSTVTSTNTLPSPPSVPSPPAVPLPPALRSPPAVRLPDKLDEKYQGDYEATEEMDKRMTLPLPSIPSESTQKVAKRESTSVLAHSVKTVTERQMKIKAVFSGFKNKLANSLPKMSSSSSSSQSPTSTQGKWPHVEDEFQIYDDLYDEPEEYPIRQGSRKQVEKENSDLEEDYEVPVEVSKWKTLSEVPKDIKNFTISDVSLCLQLLNVAKYVTPFRERSVDGAFLRKLDKKTLMQMFKMQEFEAKQLVTFARDNWRPKL